MLLLIPLLLIIHAANCGHFLFWLPMRFCMFFHVSTCFIYDNLQCFFLNSLIQRLPLQRQECQDSRDWAGAGSCQKRPPSDRGLSDQGEERGGIWEEFRRLLMNNISLRKVKYIACKQKLHLKYIYKLFLLKGEERQRNSQPFRSGRAAKCDIRKATRWKGRNALSHIHRGDFLFIHKNWIYSSLGQYGKQPLCTWDARSERSAQRRGKTVQPTLDVCMYRMGVGLTDRLY